MIFVGTDIVEVKRVKAMMEKNSGRFLQKIFTDNEIDYCSQRSVPSMHYAGRFSAKEAVKKALLSYDESITLPLKNIEILHRSDGAPIVKLRNMHSKGRTISLSISHTEELATAMAVLEIK